MHPAPIDTLGPITALGWTSAVGSFLKKCFINYTNLYLLIVIIIIWVVLILFFII